MNRNILLLIIFTFLITSVFANLEMGVEKIEYFVESNEEFELNINLSAYDSDESNIRYEYQLEVFFDDEDYKDYFNLREYRNDGTLCINSTTCSNKKIRFKIRTLYSVPSDEYDDIYVRLKYRVIGTTNWSELRENIIVNVNNFEDDLDVYFEKNYICKNSSFAYLIIDNQTNDDIEMNLRDNGLENSQLWPYIKDRLITVKENDARKLYVEFRKTPIEGKYNLVFDSEYTQEGKKKLFRKNLYLDVRDCVNDITDFKIYSQSSNNILKVGQNRTINFTVENNSNEDRDLFFNVNSSENFSANVVNPQRLIRANSRENIVVEVIPKISTNNTTLTLSAYSNNSQVDASTRLNILVEDLSVEYNIKSSKLGLKLEQVISIKNNSQRALNLTLSIERKDSDVLNIDKQRITLNPNQTENVVFSAIGKTEGYKVVKLQISGDLFYNKDIIYTISGTETPTSFLKEYTQVTNFNKNSTNNLKLLFENPYDFSVNINIVSSGVSGIIPQSKTFVLEPKQIKEEDLRIIVGDISNSKNNLNFEIITDISRESFPFVAYIGNNLESINSLEVIDLPAQINYVSGIENKIPIKIKNNSNTNVENVFVEIKVNNITKSAKLVTLNANEEKIVDFEVLFKEKGNLLGEIYLSENNKYSISFNENTNFLSSGLFSLGFGSSLGVIFGIIILALLASLMIMDKKQTKNTPSDGFKVNRGF